MSAYGSFNPLASFLPMQDLVYRPGHRSGFAEGLKSSDMDLFGARDQKKLSLKRNGNDAVMTTPGGYTITASSRDKAEGGNLLITSPDGTTTEIWGDPHVDKINPDGTKQRQLDFYGRTTFTLPDKTVITMDVEDMMLSGVAVTNGDEGVLMQGMLNGRNKLEVETGYGPMLDAMVGDGNVMHMGKDNNFYVDNEFGGRRQVTQEEVAKREAMLNGGVGDNLEASNRIGMDELWMQIRSFLRGFDPGFMSMTQSGSFMGGLSSNAGFGQFGLDYDASIGMWG
jgi:hypothetical protein